MSDGHINRLVGWSVVGICLMAFVAIAAITATIYEYVPHSEDEVAYVFQAKVFASNRLVVPTPPAPDAFWTPFVVDYQGLRFSIKYPIGWSLLLSLGYRLGLPWLINTLLGSASLGLMAWLAAQLYGKQPAATGVERFLPLWVAGLGLLTPGFLFLSSSLLSHPASLFWTALALLSFYRLVSGSSARKAFWAFGTGFCLGWVFIIRPFDALGIALPLGLFLLAAIWRHECRWTAFLWLSLGGLLISLLPPLYWWSVVGQPFFDPYLLVWPYDKPGFGPDVGPQGYFLRDGLFLNTPLKLRALATGLFGWPGWSSLFFLPLAFITGQAKRWDWLLLSTILGTIFVYIFYWAFGGVDGGFPRYYYAALPAFLLLTVRGLTVSAQLLADHFGSKADWLLSLVVVGLMSYNLIWHLPPLLTAQKGRYAITPTPLNMVAQADLPGPNLILVEGFDSWHDFAAPFAANDPTLSGKTVFAIDWNQSYTADLRRHFLERDCYQLREKTLSPCPGLEE